MQILYVNSTALGFNIGRASLGKGKPCFIIAEAGVNHNGSVDLAKKLIDAAKAAGADAIKFQTFIPEEIVSEVAGKADYQKKNDPRHSTQLEMLSSLALKPTQFQELESYCRKKGILFLSTPFDTKSADFLDGLGMPAFKIPSGELTNLELIRHIAKKKKPIILSTGMADIKEISSAIEVIYATGNRQIVVLQCTTSYPAPPDSLNLLAIQTLEKKFKLLVGFSDHSEGILAPIAAVALGACLIEKHFTLDKNMAGPDHRSSLEPNELQEMVVAIRQTESMLGTGIKKPQATELGLIKFARRSIFTATALGKGEILTKDKLAAKRPLIGIPAEESDRIIGKILKKPIAAGKPIHWSDLEGA